MSLLHFYSSRWRFPADVNRRKEMAEHTFRLKRYRQFIDNQFVEGLLKNQEYSLEGLREPLKGKILDGQFKQIVFTGMGCSAVVSDLIKVFFAFKNVPINVFVLNDYDLAYLIGRDLLKDKATLVVISSYSGYSQEPVHAYRSARNFTDNIVFLTSGGRLAEIGIEENISIIYWKLKDPDREYPLFHVPQYFSSLLDIFWHLGVLESNYQDELAETVRFLRAEFTAQKIALAKKIAVQLHDHEIILLATPKWYQGLLKIVKMHFNEIAMVPAHGNFFHEFCHSEIAVFTNPQTKMGILLFKDKDEDEYTEKKMANLVALLSSDQPQNRNIAVAEIEMNQSSFLQQLFSTLLFVHFITFELGCYTNTESRDLISEAAGNPWYNSKTIKQELGTMADAYTG
jgi:glucose/mannose-6-phosphate isomerase